jgi:hypothetical protein
MVALSLERSELRRRFSNNLPNNTIQSAYKEK